MKRRLRSNRSSSWQNPLQDLAECPFLGSTLFPIDPSTRLARDQLEILKRYYTRQRATGDVDPRSLERYLQNPEQDAFVVWGEVGIGKTWFVRYQLEKLSQEKAGAFQYGVVDMLRATPANAQQQLILQVLPVLESYFVMTLGSLENGLRALAINRSRRRFGSRFSVKDRVFQNQVSSEIIKILDKEGVERTHQLLEAIEAAEGPLLFLAIDNLDRSVGKEQADLAEMVVRMLRNSQIRLVLPLRPSSRQVLDQFQILGFLQRSEMHLSPVDPGRLLEKRFSTSLVGTDLSKLGLPGTDRNLTFPMLLREFLESEAGPFVLSLCGSNARKVIEYVNRILYSNQLLKVENLANAEACTAALLMLDSSPFDQRTTGLVNLFDNGEPRSPGNELIRFRVLEFLHHHVTVLTGSTQFYDHFECLGYSLERVKNVLALFIGVGLVSTSTEGMVTEVARRAELADLGRVKVAQAYSETYFSSLLTSPWYFICAKRGIHIEEHLISRDREGDEWVKDGVFIDFLKAAEDDERFRLKEWKRRGGGYLSEPLMQPHAMARSALAQRGGVPRDKSRSR